MIFTRGGEELAMEKRKTNQFYEFISAVEEGHQLDVTSDSTFCICNDSIYKYEPGKTESTPHTNIEIWHVWDDSHERWGRMLHFAEDIVGGALRLRGLALSAPKLYDEEGIEFRMPLYILDEVNVDENRESLEAIQSIKFTVVKLKE